MKLESIRVLFLGRTDFHLSLPMVLGLEKSPKWAGKIEHPLGKSGSPDVEGHNLSAYQGLTQYRDEC